jgi:hypothetical protein
MDGPAALIWPTSALGSRIDSHELFLPLQQFLPARSSIRNQVVVPLSNHDPKYWEQPSEQTHNVRITRCPRSLLRRPGACLLKPEGLASPHLTWPKINGYLRLVLHRQAWFHRERCPDASPLLIVPSSMPPSSKQNVHHREHGEHSLRGRKRHCCQYMKSAKADSCSF